MDQVQDSRCSTTIPLPVNEPCQDVRERQILAEQKVLLKLIAAGRPLDECLQAVTQAIARLHPSANGCVLIANQERTAIDDIVAPRLPSSFSQVIRGAPISELAIGTCGRAIQTGQTVTCSDIAGSKHWSKEWQNLCLTHGIHACRSTPLTGSNGNALASFLLCFSEAHEPDEWEVHIAEFCADVATIAIERERSNRSQRENEARLEAELEDSRLLQDVSARLIQGENTQALYEEILDAAVAIMQSDYASMQMLSPDSGNGNGGKLRLLAFRGFNSVAAKFWEWVRVDSGSTCGVALRTGKRVVVANVENCTSMAGTDDLAIYLQTGIHAVQTTPLVSRGGKLLGMLSTHWSEPHEPSARDLGLLDILARQAADLIESKQSEEALRQSTIALAEADRRKDEFLATLAHELRNPLAPIQTGIDMLRLMKDDSHLADDSLNMMERQMHHLVRLVDDLLDISRITRGQVKLRRERTDIRESLGRALEATGSFINAGRRQIHVDYPPSPLLVDADPVRLVQIIGNLLNNAAKYTAEDGNIWVTILKEKGKAKISVRDNGIGMAPETRTALFQMFMQADPMRTDGLGIGLALVRSFVELQGGTVEARSAGLGQGSEFIVALPLAGEEQQES